MGVKLRVDRRRPVARIGIGSVTGHRRDRAVRRHSADEVSASRDQQVASAVVRQPPGLEPGTESALDWDATAIDSARVDISRAVDCERLNQSYKTGDAVNRSVRGDLANPAIESVCDVEIAMPIRGETRRIVKLRGGGRSAVA